MSLTVAPPETLAVVPRRSTADRWMRRLLRLPVDAPAGTAEGARKAFQTSLFIATIRCGLMYVVFPFVLPALGIARGVGPAIGSAVNIVAIVCITLSLRRFFRADHPKRWWYAALGGSVLFLLVGLVVADIAALA
jgi:glycopeptide antibiotics resistance protein